MKRILLCIALATSTSFAFAQPMMVKDINPGTPSSSPEWLTDFNGKLIFAANDGTNGTELWMRDSAGGASLVYNINPGGPSSIFNGTYMRMAVVGNKVYFPASNGTNGEELYMWDGSGAPSLVADINPGAASSSIDYLFAMGGRVYFAAYGNGDGVELWSHDPATNNTTQLADIYGGSGSSNPNEFTEFNGKLYFRAYSPTTGYEIYMYDPTTNNTTVAADVYPGSGSSSPYGLMVWDNKLYFTAYSASNGYELFVMDTNNMPLRITDVNSGSSSSTTSFSPGVRVMMGMNGYIYFNATDGSSGYQLYRYNPMNNSTSLVYSIYPTGSSLPQDFIEYGGKMYFRATDMQHGSELWMYDGTNAPMMVADIYSGTNSGFPTGMVVVDSTMYFAANDSATGRELYMIKDSTLGIQNVRFQAEVKVYPNPTTSDVYLDMQLENSEQLAVRVADAMGRVIYQTPMTQYNAGNNKVTIPLGNVAAGVYYYNIVGADGAGYMAGRIMKQ
ncbi:MAG: T9SS type A sorting domain-containing protein [Chitinophagales bacterium]|nr:T9SS type A sorting domain-containing protein [Chitinophagaceae bacterium]MCB9063553.1 T9SS type A sorting domain-containing protein [Chitinophagales bacterium]